MTKSLTNAAMAALKSGFSCLLPWASYQDGQAQVVSNPNQIEGVVSWNNNPVGL